MIAAVLATVGLTGLGIASAAQLGVGSSTLGAGTAVVGSCQPVDQAIRVGFTSSWQTSLNPDAYGATQVVLSNVSATCAGQEYRVAVVNASGGLLVEVSGTVPTGGGTITSSTFGAVAVTTIAQANVVIHS
jgi:hypothetical protein